MSDMILIASSFFMEISPSLVYRTSIIKYPAFYLNEKEKNRLFI